MMKLKPDFLRGSYPPLVTPFKNGEVDYSTYERLIERQIAGGSHGILVNGTTSEPSTLTVEERNKLVAVAVKTAARRVPVVAATGSQSHADSVALSKAAEKAGADALLILTPYFIRPPQRGMAEYFIDLAKRTSLPVMIYHIPGRAAVNITVDTVAQIADAAPNLVGIKHAFNDLTFVTELLVRMGPEFRVHVGLEDLSLPMLAVGASGLMNAVGNLAPDKIAALYEKTAAGDLAGAKALHYELFELNQSVFFDTNPIPIKYMMKRLGILPNEEHRLPMVPATAELAKRLDAVLERAGLLGGAARKIA
ncbi:MAG: 4-hydroxy-tetrahydrodipicolinate synthase [Alphaproteobacteria bacterium]|nr:4-hydroxy-tetrahydrodipicolinate synthase [Alphaproteobacteria bacterium]